MSVILYDVVSDILSTIPADILSCRYYHFTTFSSMPPALPENSGE